MNCIHIVGNRPQFVKLALLHRALSEENGITQQIIHTGQHYDEGMSGVFFGELSIPAPDFQLSVNQLPHYAQIGRMTEQIGEILDRIKPSGVIIYGDTNTTLAGALAAKKTHIPIAHVESGIRTNDEQMPEETNRYLADRMADLNFCPTLHCLKNLEQEGFLSMKGKKLFFTGDIMLDAYRLSETLSTENSEDAPQDMVLATIHREENNRSSQRLSIIIEELNKIAAHLPVIMPCHPRTAARIRELGLKTLFDLRQPLSYIEMMRLLRASSYVITDSGGFCREAFFAGKPSVVVMDHPFWPEIIETGACLPAAAQINDISAKFAALNNLNQSFPITIFGKGDAAKQMAGIIVEEWKK